MSNPLFARKSLASLLAEAKGDNRLKRVLGPITLTSLGVGAIIGAGIFVATGAAAKEVAGPALMLSYGLAGLTCIFAAFCYAEFASMAPVAGSAYTYAYCTMGELFAWIIGWDLVLEYAVGSATVANGWSGYFQSVLAKFGIIVPMAFCAAPYTYDEGTFRTNVYAEYRAVIDGKEQAVRVTQKLKDEKVQAEDGTEKEVRILYWKHTDKSYEKTNQPEWLGKAGDRDVESKLQIQQALVNLPAVLIVFLVTAILVKGISESAGFNAFMVFIKLAAVVFVILVGMFYINPKNYEPFAPFGYVGFSFFEIPQLTFGNVMNGKPVGVLAGAAIIFFAYIGFDSVSTHAEEARRPERDVPIGIIASLFICTILYVGVVAVLTGMVSYKNIDKDAGVSNAFKAIGLGWAEFIIAAAGVAGITSVLLVMMLSGPRVFLAMARDGLVPKGFFADVHPTFRTPWKSTIAIGTFVAILTGVLPINALLELTNIGTLFAFVIVCAAVLIMRETDPYVHRSFRCPFVPVVPILGIILCLVLMLSLPIGNWLRLVGWLVLGLFIYCFYGRFHSTLRQEVAMRLSGEPSVRSEAIQEPPGDPGPIRVP
jgi:APA family basic amino acid/polyamine antiporter